MLTADEQKWVEDRRSGIEKWAENCKYEDFIDDEKIWAIINGKQTPERQETLAVIEKARSNTPEGKMLSPEDVAVLMNTTDPELVDAIFEAAMWIKNTVYGNRIVLFAPLYLSDTCVNNCAYCGFQQSNKSLHRKVLNPNEVAKEVEMLVDVGHKRLITVYGEHPQSDADYICETVEKVYSVHKGYGEIRRCNINAAPMFVDEYKRIKEVGIGTYQIFQETYHHETYRKVHPRRTVKGHYGWRQFGLHRALEAGIDDVAPGVLFGLYDWRFDLLGMLYHAMSLEKEFGIGPHTMSYPRMVYAENAPLATNSKYLVNDDDFKKLVAIIRLMCPYTGSILTAREAPALRREMMGKCGISQGDAGTRIGVGGYAEMEKEHLLHKEQFCVQDSRSLDDFIHDLCEDGFLPSFCTAGYREGRTGANFMPLAKHATVKNYCIANGILTFKEYLMDYASPRVREVGEKVTIPNFLKWVEEHVPGLVGQVKTNLKLAEKNDERDLHF